MFAGRCSSNRPAALRQAVWCCLAGVWLLIANSPVYAQGCFDDWFCFSVTPHNGAYQVTVQRIAPYPVVLTLYSSQLIRDAHVSVSLTDDRAAELGLVNDPRSFWRSMRVKWTGGILDARHNDTVRYRYPLQPRQRYRIVQGFNGGYSHRGRSQYTVDIAASVGTPVYAARAGTVIDTEADNRIGGADPSIAAYANYVILLHDDGTTGEYFHLKYQGVAVKRGDQVATGELLGYSGNTGFSSLPHLHFGVYQAKPHGSFQSVPFKFTD